MNHYGRKRRWFVWMPLVFIAAALLMGLLVKLLWNAILPPVLGVNMLSYWQALGLLVLSRILFSGFWKGGYRRWGGSPMWREKWMNMNEEEKAKFREEWKRRCGSYPEEKSGTTTKQPE